MEVKNPICYRPAIQKGKHAVSNEQFMDYFESHFASQLRDYKENPTKAVEKARHIATESMKIQQRYFCRQLAELHKPLTPQQQSEMFIKIGLEMATTVVEKALANAGIKSSEINCIVFTSHQPFPFPAFTAHLMSSMVFAKDCSQVFLTLFIPNQTHFFIAYSIFHLSLELLRGCLIFGNRVAS